MRTTRRTFFSGVAALTTPLTASAAVAAGGRDDLGARLAALEDAKAIRELQQTYARLLNAGERQQLAALFAEPARVRIDATVRNVVPDALATNEIAVEAGTATARLPCAVETATPIDDTGTLTEMARLQGEGFIKRSERRVLVSSLVKRDGIWQFVKAEFQA